MCMWAVLGSSCLPVMISGNGGRARPAGDAGPKVASISFHLLRAMSRETRKYRCDLPGCLSLLLRVFCMVPEGRFPFSFLGSGRRVRFPVGTSGLRRRGREMFYRRAAGRGVDHRVPMWVHHAESLLSRVVYCRWIVLAGMESGCSAVCPKNWGESCGWECCERRKGEGAPSSHGAGSEGAGSARRGPRGAVVRGPRTAASVSGVRGPTRPRPARLPCPVRRRGPGPTPRAAAAARSPRGPRR